MNTKLMIVCEVCREPYWFDHTNMQILLYAPEFHCKVCNQYSVTPHELKLEVKKELFKL